MADVDFGDLIQEGDNLIKENVEFKPLEPDVYDGEIVHAEGVVFNSGSKGITLQFTPDETNRKIFHNIVFSDNEQSRAITIRFLRGIGLDIEDLRKGKIGVADALVGKRVRTTLIIEEYNGKLNNKIKYLNPIPGYDYSSDETVATAKSESTGSGPKKPF